MNKLSLVLMVVVATTIQVAAANPVLAKKSKDKGLGGPVGGYDAGFARGSEEARNAVAKLDSNQIKKLMQTSLHHVQQWITAMVTLKDFMMDGDRQ